MFFDSWQAVWVMAGHGGYVWSAYAITFVTLAALLWLPVQRKRRSQRWLRDFYRRQDDLRQNSYPADSTHHSGDYEV